MNTPSIEKKSFEINEKEAEKIIHDFEDLAQEAAQKRTLSNEAFLPLLNLLYILRDFEKFKVRPSTQQFMALHAAQKKFVNNIRVNDFPDLTLKLLVNLGVVLEAEIGRYRIFSKLSNE